MYLETETATTIVKKVKVKHCYNEMCDVHKNKKAVVVIGGNIKLCFECGENLAHAIFATIST
jgi:hypothetical protein